ncbi:hypothetical protein [Kineococcus sp. SYSU DK001]|uniref:hypothetical protein n=1 Tax=Kineococcus sp. SYSU DK001 TaxID=3383122 RepID=UPI003D7D5F62
MPRGERQELLQDVRADLLVAHAATGSTNPRVLLGTDTATFAADVVRERGLQRPRGRYTTVLVFAVVAVLVAVVAIWPLLHEVFDAVNPSPSGPMPITAGTTIEADGSIKYPAEPLTAGQEAVMIGGWALGGLMVAALMVVGVHVALRRRARAAATVWRAAVLIPVSVAVTLPAAMFYAKQTDYSTAPAVVIFECALVLGGAIMAVVVARWWAFRTQPSTVAA